jgi:hypothetical protein
MILKIKKNNQHYQVNFKDHFCIYSFLILLEIGSKISSFFSSKKSETNPTENTETNTKGTNTSDNATTVPPKADIIREPLVFKLELLDYADPSSEAQANSIKK